MPYLISLPLDQDYSKISTDNIAEPLHGQKICKFGKISIKDYTTKSDYWY